MKIFLVFGDFIMKRFTISVVFTLLALGTFLIPAIPVAASGPINAPRIHLKNGISTNWSGYAVQTNLNSPQSGVITDVKGTWNVPLVQSSPTGYSAVWVGIDGYSDGTVEQIGTEQDSNGTPYAWFEMYPKMSYRITGFTINPGDSITAEVEYTGNGAFTLTITDNSVINNSNPEFFSTTQRNHNAQRNSAEWVVEAPYSGGILPLANFVTVPFTGASFTDSSNNTLPIDATGWQYDPMEMVDPSGGTAAPSNLTNSGTAFSVTYGVPAPPQNLMATASNNQVTLSWSAPSTDGGSTITGYNIYRSTSSGEETLLISAGNVLTYTDSNVNNGTTYYYEVTAVNSKGESIPSNEASATPSATSTSTLTVTLSPTDASYSTNSFIYPTVTVTYNNTGLQGASVNVTILYPNGSTAWTGSGTTNSSGVVQFKIRIQKNAPTGTYTESATASLSGYQSGSDTTTFTVN